MSELEYLSAELASGDDERAEIAAKRLSHLGEQALGIINQLLSDPDPETRWWAVRSLAEMSSNSFSQLLIKALNDKDLSVRQCAALALQHQPDSDSVPALIACMHDRDSLLIRLSANALVAIGPPAVPALLKLLDDRTSPIRYEAIRALALIGDERAIPALFHSFGEDSALMEYWADQGLDRMGIGMAFFKP
ncbi:MAG: HEAT repeat domain-containing protein [Anaerolineales bacterium]|jgi:HEAT repeat protein